MLATAKRQRGAQARATQNATAANPIPIRPVRLSRLTQANRENIRERLKGCVDDFVESATMEEQYFMIDVLQDREGITAPDGPRGLSDHEVPIYSAIQRQFDGNRCVVVPDDDMVHEVEAFITALDRKSLKKKEFSRATTEEITERLGRRFQAEVELFMRDAGAPSFRLMLDMLARWNEIQSDEGQKLPDNILAVAAEIELEKVRAELAARAIAEKNKES